MRFRLPKTDRRDLAEQYLKAQIKNLAKKKNIKAQVLLQNYMFERFWERLSLSEYKEKFILKGGMLVASIVDRSAGKSQETKDERENAPER